MKKLLFLFAALFVFAACDDDAIDYSTWTTEELLATPAGIEYLIKNAAPIDYAAIEEELETLVFYPYYFSASSIRKAGLNLLIGAGWASLVIL